MGQTLSTQLVFACDTGVCVACVACTVGDGAGAMINDRRQGWDALMCSRIGFDP